ncbi:NADH-quinone oxidoreductase subunit F/NADP-reducing hydrogenase subunit HndC [Thermodesulfitimonas autotrophica]|uniref:NADH-quinone oxidoreductase subunit F/NADP-reducing hydrogenase subunit HndC n=1 Tax=Thermodesulfitimonas autotrophica TaxID=1894989 RepID=A0A3N5ABT7_9THEO|nr:NuoF family protein [Thermodesulfitimonas autotrophica]RPF43049.1 NADH-quinone oxidoreductase subunit F/NADP-reducing hydrogenase subunit HndC [Thermodesulfitimonas autotrophica]
MLQSTRDLAELRQRLLPRLSFRTPAAAGPPAAVLVCTSMGCLAAKSEAVIAALKEEVAALGLDVTVHETGCLGLCKFGPAALVYPGQVLYLGLDPDAVRKIAREHLRDGRLVAEHLFRDPETGAAIAQLPNIPFFRRQLRAVLAQVGVIDPGSLEDYIAAGGYAAFATVLGWQPEAVVAAVSRAGLRGRGGAGFPTGRKWAAAAAQPAKRKYIVCNADEGDPGAFMDRSIIEGTPHAVLEGMLIAGYAVGAQEGIVYVRAEYPLAVKRLETAIRQARRAGLLGKNLLGSDFSFDVEICHGAGAFVCGEETALLASVMGRRGESRPRPPYPVEEGLWGEPTVLNNVETLANVPLIIRKGPEWFAGIGTEKSKGTKIFSLAGSINITGLIEVPMGVSLREIVFGLGYGPPAGRELKAVQTGGPSGGFLPARHLDTPVDYESLKELGTIMGSGGMIVLDEASCMVDVARFYTAFGQDESCGRCTPCRVGTKRMVELLDRITGGTATVADLELLEKLAEDVKDASLCGLGQTVPNPVLSSLRFFRDEYLAHVKERRCPAGRCRKLLH